MDGEKRCLAARRAGGAHDKTIINQIMLRFRPIAPKPANNNPVSGDLMPAKEEMATKKRGKRKYVRNNKNTKCMKNKVATTLQLLPEITVKKDSPEIGISNGVDFLGSKSVQQLPSTWMSSDRADVVESWVTVECVTGTCAEEEEEGRWLGCTDWERIRNLETDTCPGFVSDGDDTVRWVNPAYTRMVVGPEEGPSSPDVAVWLVVKERFAAEWGAFSCRVRVVYCRCGGKEKQYYSQIVPCDVWRMEKLGQGFLWRLDVEAALSLGPKYQVTG